MRDHYDLLRAVDLDGFELRVWDTHEQLRERCGAWRAHQRLAYELRTPCGFVLFSGEDFGASPMHAIDSDEAVRAILSFLVLRPGDTDAEFFADYNDEQMAFAQGDAEYLGIWTLDDGPPLVDLDLDDDDLDAEAAS